jgi:uncharacterized membrane protein YeaQ/YmgE (transglycosylase-associated protein family)
VSSAFIQGGCTLVGLVLVKYVTYNIMEQLIPLLTNLVTGAVGGNAAGAAMKDKSLGFTGNTVAGIVGSLLSNVAGGSQLMGVASMLGLSGMSGSVASSGVSGAIAMAAFAYAKPYLAQYLPILNSIGGANTTPKA